MFCLFNRSDIFLRFSSPQSSPILNDTLLSIEFSNRLFKLSLETFSRVASIQFFSMSPKNHQKTQKVIEYDGLVIYALLKSTFNHGKTSNQLFKNHRKHKYCRWKQRYPKIDCASTALKLILKAEKTLYAKFTIVDSFILPFFPLIFLSLLLTEASMNISFISFESKLILCEIKRKFNNTEKAAADFTFSFLPHFLSLNLLKLPKADSVPSDLKQIIWFCLEEKRFYF